MKNSLKVLSAIIVVSFFVFSACKPTEKIKKSKEPINKYSMAFEVPDSVSYSIGLSMSNYLQRQGIQSVNQVAYDAGMKAGAKLGGDSKTIIDSIGQVIQEFMIGYNEEMQAKMTADSTFQPEPMDLNEAISANFGILLGSSLIAQNLGKANIDKLVLGVKDHFADTPKYDSELSGVMLQRYFDMTDSLRVGLNEQYLTDNKVKEGVITTASGLQYQVITKGDGAIPAATDFVRVNYKGTFISGKTFDSSYDRGEPAEFPLSGVIPGWAEGLSLMPIGSKYIFTIPQDLAYGKQGTRDGSISPKSTLVFEVELLDIVTPPTISDETPETTEPVKGTVD
jgi:FKBP-type peptidyl-prolyl cis-trans isomerase